eukprot:665791-Pleurochrysis_carterae.AAC.1
MAQRMTSTLAFLCLLVSGSEGLGLNAKNTSTSARTASAASELLITNGWKLLSFTPACNAHSACAGLTGDCCPTTKGVILGCCDNAPTNQSPPPPQPQCAAHASCASLGLEGDCCPTSQGVILGCCDSEDTPPVTTA